MQRDTTQVDHAVHHCTHAVDRVVHRCTRAVDHVVHPCTYAVDHVVLPFNLVGVVVALEVLLCTHTVGHAVPPCSHAVGPPLSLVSPHPAGETVIPLPHPSNGNPPSVGKTRTRLLSSYRRIRFVRLLSAVT